MAGRPESCFRGRSKKDARRPLRSWTRSSAWQKRENRCNIQGRPEGGVPMEMDRSDGRAAGIAPDAAAQGKQDILSRSLFAELAGESRLALLDLGVVERLPRKFTVAVQGEPPRSFLLVGAGRIKLERARGDHSFPLGHRGPGQMVGETALGLVAEATETASVIDDVEALAIPIADLRRQLA